MAVLFPSRAHLDQNAQDRYRRVLPPDHPNTWRSKRHLADDLRKLSEADDSGPKSESVVNCADQPDLDSQISVIPRAEIRA